VANLSSPDKLSKFKEPKVTDRPARRTNTAGVAAAITFIAVISLVFITACGTASQSAEEVALESLTSQEVARYQEILVGTMNTTVHPSRTVRNELWVMVDKMGGLSSKEALQARETLTGIILVYGQMYWEEALLAFQSGVKQRSKERVEYEKDAIARELGSQSQFDANQENLDGIAAGNPIMVQGQLMVVDEELILAALRNIEGAAARVDLLFTRP